MEFSSIPRVNIRIPVRKQRVKILVQVPSKTQGGIRIEKVMLTTYFFWAAAKNWSLCRKATSRTVSLTCR